METSVQLFRSHLLARVSQSFEMRLKALGLLSALFILLLRTQSLSLYLSFGHLLPGGKAHPAKGSPPGLSRPGLSPHMARLLCFYGKLSTLLGHSYPRIGQAPINIQASIYSTSLYSLKSKKKQF